LQLPMLLLSPFSSIFPVNLLQLCENVLFFYRQ
jgi:hypothetical protein